MFVTQRQEESVQLDFTRDEHPIKMSTHDFDIEIRIFERLLEGSR